VIIIIYIMDMNCSDLYKSERVQDLQTKSIRSYVDMLIKEYGGVPANTAAEYKKGFRKGFMEECKRKKTEIKKTLSKQKSKKTRRR
jgi:hypothetical protein